MWYAHEMQTSLIYGQAKAKAIATQLAQEDGIAAAIQLIDKLYARDKADASLPEMQWQDDAQVKEW